MATLKQQMAIANLVKTSGNVSKAMRMAGYPEATVNNPQMLTRSKTFQQLFKKRLSPQKLLRVHEEGLQATKVQSSPTEPDTIIPDYDTRFKYLALGYKVQGIGDNNGNGGNTQINISFDGTGYIPPDNTLNLKPTKRK